MAIQFPTGWTSRDYQDEFFRAMGSGVKRACLIWHRRAGKDVSVLNWLISEASRKTGVYYYFFPTFAQGRKVLWDGKDKEGRRYIEYIPFLDRCRINEAEMKITFPPIEGGSNGSIIQIVGTDNYDSLMGTNPVGCVFSEYSLQHPGAWEFIEPILVENGGWAAFVYTPRGPNHGKDLYDYAKTSPDWYCSLLTIQDTKREDGTPVVSMEAIEKLRAAGKDESFIQQEWFCDFAGSQVGSYYANQMRKITQEGRITYVPYNPRVPVYVYADIGHADETVLGFCQFYEKRIWWINCLAEKERDLPYFASEIDRLARTEGYRYGGFYWPHDMKVVDFGSGEQRVKVARRLGLNPSHIVTKAGVSDGIEAVRNKLNISVFDKDKCEKLISALHTYRKEYDEENKVFKATPVHDWASHYADMVRVMATSKSVTNQFVGMGAMTKEAPLAMFSTDPLKRDEPEPTWESQSALY